MAEKNQSGSKSNSQAKTEKNSAKPTQQNSSSGKGLSSRSFHSVEFSEGNSDSVNFTTHSSED